MHWAKESFLARSSKDRNAITASTHRCRSIGIPLPPNDSPVSRRGKGEMSVSGQPRRLTGPLDETAARDPKDLELPGGPLGGFYPALPRPANPLASTSSTPGCPPSPLDDLSVPTTP